MRNSKKKRILFSATLAIVSLGVGLSAAEGLVRWLAPQKLTGSLFETDAAIGYKNRPNLRTTQEVTLRPVSIRTNHLGLRQDVEVSATKGPREVRVLLLGDSFTFGWGVEHEESYAGILQKQLSAAFPQHQITLMNAGVGGFGLQNYLAYLDEYGLNLEPDVVAVFLGPNDVEENLAFGLFSQTAAGELKRHPIKSNFRFKAKVWFNRAIGHPWVVSRSHFVQLLRKATIGQMRVNEVAPITAASSAPKEEKPKWEDLSSLFRFTESLILELNKTSRAHRARFVVAPVGHPLKYTGSFLNNHWNWMENHLITYSRAAEFLENEARKNNVRTQLPEDYHYNRYAHRRYAELVFPVLKDQVQTVILSQQRLASR